MTEITNATPATQEIAPSTGLPVDQLPVNTSLLDTMAKKWGVDPKKLHTTLKNTVFKPVKRGNDYIPVTDEQLMSLLIVAKQYNLDPFVKEIYAFPAKDGSIVPVVGVDGWARIMNDHPQYDGMDFKYSEEMVTMADARPCYEWIECSIWRKDKDKPTKVREYLDECYRPSKYQNSPGPWQTHPKRFLRHKAMIQAARIAFGFSGIYDKDEAHRIIDAQAVNTDNAKNITPRISNADAFTANYTPDVTKEAKPHETPVDVTPPPENETGEVYIVQLPTGSTPPSVPCDSVKIAAKAMVKEIGDRYQKGKHEEIQWIVKNNSALLERIKTEEPEKFKVIDDLAKVITNEPTNIYQTQGELA